MLPNQFVTSGEGTISSYDGMDVATGVGYKKYYCIGGTNSVLALLPDPVDSYVYSTSSFKAAGTASGDWIDLDFDVEFKQPQVIEGKAIVVPTLYLDLDFIGGGRTATAKATVYIYKVVGGVETLIGSDTNMTAISSTADPAIAKRSCSIFDVAKTSFGIGDKLRVNVRVYGTITNVGGESVTVKLFHDGSNRLTSVVGDGTFTTFSTDLVAYIPFKIVL